MMSALPPIFTMKADIPDRQLRARGGCEQPQQTAPFIRSITRSGAGKQQLWDHDAESLRRPEIDHEFEFRRRLNRKVRRLRTAKDAIHVSRGTPEKVRGVHPLG
jgi:hypothetical protein